MKKVLFLAISIGLSLVAADITPRSHDARNPAVDEALQECRNSIQTESSTSKPNMYQMDQCMGSKGFQKPPMRSPRDRDIKEISSGAVQN